MSEPKGYCPFCSVSGWEICDHFTGYLRGKNVTAENPVLGSRTSNMLRPLKASEVTVNTGISVRVYARGK